MANPHNIQVGQSVWIESDIGRMGSPLWEYTVSKVGRTKAEYQTEWGRKMGSFYLETLKTDEGKYTQLRVYLSATQRDEERETRAFAAVVSGMVNTCDNMEKLTRIKAILEETK